MEFVCRDLRLVYNSVVTGDGFLSLVNILEPGQWLSSAICNASNEAHPEETPVIFLFEKKSEGNCHMSSF